MRLPFACVLAAGLLLAGGCGREEAPEAAAPEATAPAPASAPAAPPPPVFGFEELHQLVAPIALYPDALLAQVLMAATYPGDVADAAAWSRLHPEQSGEAAVLRVADQPWDPSVQALVAFPQALALLGQDPGWVQRLGDAFLAQPDAVMDAVQRLRRKAQAAGFLESNQYQSVTSVAADATGAAGAAGDLLLIEPGHADVMYAPAYDPYEAYGDWDYDDYPPVYYAPPAYWYGPIGRGLLWGLGVAIADGLWGDIDWNDGDIDIDIDRFNDLHGDRLGDGDRTWRHDPLNRDGVPYRDRDSRERFGRQLGGADRRHAFRGDEPSRAQARAAMAERGIDPARSNLDAQRQARVAAAEQPGLRDAAGRGEGLGDRAGGDAAGARDAAAAADYAARMRAGEIAIPESPADRARAETAVREHAVRQEQQRQRERQYQQERSNEAVRSQARQQYASSSRGGAFAGAGRPAQTRASRDRGDHSRRADRSSSSRPGHTVSRPARAPARGGGRGR